MDGTRDLRQQHVSLPARSNWYSMIQHIQPFQLPHFQREKVRRMIVIITFLHSKHKMEYDPYKLTQTSWSVACTNK
jgi:hypothetical protein